MNPIRYFIEPLDVLFLRGGKLFGDAGSFGESLIPPWPSVAAGALRSALLAHKGLDPARFARGEIKDSELGTPKNPGPFTLTAFHLARRDKDGRVEPLYLLPADLVAGKNDNGKLEVRRLSPHALAGGILCSSTTDKLAVLAEPTRSKPESGLWLTAEGMRAHLAGQPIDPENHLVSNGDLWGLDVRVGVGLDPARRMAADGKLFTTQAAALRKREHGSGHDVGFLAEIAGADMPETLSLRLGGDGRGALASRLADAVLPQPDYEAISRARHCRVVLTSPGIFSPPLPAGEGPGLGADWRPTGTDADLGFELHGIKAKLVSAAVPRAEVVSGFDLAKWEPKPAQRVAPTGSVYWLDELDASPDALRKLAGHGLWPESAENTTRRAEGFNRFTFAVY